MKAPNPSMSVRSIKVDVRQIGYIRWCLESHDGIATPTTRLPEGDILDLTIAPDYLQDAESLIDALIIEVQVERVAAPDVSPLCRPTDG